MTPEKNAGLAGLRLLVPRPRREPDKFVELLRARGCEPWLEPVIEIAPLPVDGQLTALERADVIIFISVNAVTHCLSALASSRLDIPGAARVFAVGNSTAECLESVGWDVSFPPDRANSEGLLELPDLQDVSGKRILICRGKGGREKLSGTLVARGALVEYLDLYDRLPTTSNRDAINRLIEGNRIEVIAVHSGAVFDALLACLTPDSRDKIKAMTFLTPGERVANLLLGAGLQNLVVAPSALPAKMVDALLHWYTEK